MNFYAQYVVSDVMSSGPLKNCYLQTAIADEVGSAVNT